MRSALGELRGQEVRAATETEDGLHLRFDSEASLSIFNPITWSGPAEGDVSALNHRRVIDVQEQEGGVALTFEDGSVLDVDLRDTAFLGPEAMVMRIPGKPIVVWN